MSSATETPVETAVPTIAGGFTIPQSPRRRLQSIQNNQASQPVTPSSPSSVDEPVSIEADEHSSTYANEQMSKGASAQMSKQSYEQVREEASTQVSNQARTHASEEASTQSSAHLSKPASASASKGASTRVSTQGSKRGSNQGSAPSETGSVEERVREMLALKRTHPGGTKGSVDMDPDLMKRVKRYLLDNGDPSFRILVIELVEAFLDKEGY